MIRPAGEEVRKDAVQVLEPPERMRRIVPTGVKGTSGIDIEDLEWLLAKTEPSKNK